MTNRGISTPAIIALIVVLAVIVWIATGSKQAPSIEAPVNTEEVVSEESTEETSEVSTESTTGTDSSSSETSVEADMSVEVTP
jgi:uncharacterized protein YpuA (DUF1002 family)